MGRKRKGEEDDVKVKPNRSPKTPRASQNSQMEKVTKSRKRKKDNDLPNGDQSSGKYPKIDINI